MSETIYQDGLGTITGRKDEITESIIFRLNWIRSKQLWGYSEAIT